MYYYIHLILYYILKISLILFIVLLFLFILYIFIKSKVNKISFFQNLKNTTQSIRLNIFIKNSIKNDLEEIKFNKIKFIVKNNEITFLYNVLSIKDLEKIKDKEKYLYRFIELQLPKYQFTTFYDEKSVRKMVGTKIK